MNNQELLIQRFIIVPVLHILRSILESHPQTSNLGFHNENWFHPRYLEKDNEHKNLDDFFLSFSLNFQVLKGFLTVIFISIVISIAFTNSFVALSIFNFCPVGLSCSTDCWTPRRVLRNSLYFQL